MRAACWPLMNLRLNVPTRITTALMTAIHRVGSRWNSFTGLDLLRGSRLARWDRRHELRPAVPLRPAPSSARSPEPWRCRRRLRRRALRCPRRRLARQSRRASFMDQAAVVDPLGTAVTAVPVAELLIGHPQ